MRFHGSVVADVNLVELHNLHAKIKGDSLPCLLTSCPSLVTTQIVPLIDGRSVLFFVANTCSCCIVTECRPEQKNDWRVQEPGAKSRTPVKVLVQKLRRLEMFPMADQGSQKENASLSCPI